MSTDNSHPESVGMTSLSAIAGKHSEMCSKLKIGGVTEVSTDSVFKVVIAAVDDGIEIAADADSTSFG